MRTRIRDTAMTYAKYISEDTRFSDLQQYLYRRTDYYKAISSFVNRYFSTHDSYRFDNMHISDLISYGEDVGFTGTISFDYVVTIEGEKSQTYDILKRQRQMALQQSGDCQSNSAGGENGDGINKARHNKKNHIPTENRKPRFSFFAPAIVNLLV